MLQIEYVNGKVDALPINCYGNVANARRWCKALILNEDMIETRLFVADNEGVEICEIYRKEL